MLGDAIINDVLMVKNEQFCLVYSLRLSASGLTWGEMISWWRARESLPADMPDNEVGRSWRAEVASAIWCAALASFLEAVVASASGCGRHCRAIPSGRSGSRPSRGCCAPTASLPHERDRSRSPGAAAAGVPAHGPENARRARHQGQRPRPRTHGFFLLLPHGVRVVVEVDGKHHYAEADEASPRLCAKMVAEDRALRLKGYEVY